MGSWYVIVTKLIEQTVLASTPPGRAGFWRAPGIREGAEKLAPRSAFRRLVESGLRAAAHPRRAA